MMGPLLRREFKANWVRRSDLALTLSFFIMVAVTAGIVWGDEAFFQNSLFLPAFFIILGVLSFLIRIGRFFEDDYRTGTFDHLRMVPFTAFQMIRVKYMTCLVLWVLPFLILSTGMVFMMTGYEALTVSYAVVTGLSFIPLSALFLGASALILGARGGATLLAILVLPLSLPYTILSVSVIDAVIHQMPFLQPLYLLGGLSLLSMPFFLWFGTLSLKQAMEHRSCTL